MNGSSLRALVLPIAGALALAACQGEKGTNGAACTVTNNGDGTATISCADGTSATVSNGTNGTDGTNGTSCTVVSNGDGTRTITCTDGTRVTVSDAVVDYAIATAEERAALNMSLVVTSVAHPDDGRPVVRFKVSDAKGNGVKGLATTTSMRLAILKLVKQRVP